MTVSETFQVVASTPPTDLPHTTAAAEIARLPDYLSVTHQRDSGTDYIVTDAAYKDEAGNAGRIYVQLDETTNAIDGIQSKVGGVWTNFKATADSIADDAVTTDKILDKNVTGMKLADGIAGDGLKFTDTTVGDVTTRVMHAEMDETSLTIDETTKKQRIKANATGVSLAAPTMSSPKVTEQITLNKDTTYEIRVGSNAEGDDIDDYKHGWIGSWAGVPIDIYIQGPTTTAIYSFRNDKLTITQNGQSVEASEGKLSVNKLKISALPTSAAGLVAGDIWSNGGVLTVVA